MTTAATPLYLLGSGAPGESPRPGSLRADLTSQQLDFASMLARGTARVGGSREERHAAARKGAEEFVSMTLVQPLLKQLRESSQAAGPFAPSSAELQFRSMFDAQLSLRMVKATNFPLVDSVARTIERARAGTPGGAKDVHA